MTEPPGRTYFVRDLQKWEVAVNAQGTGEGWVGDACGEGPMNVSGRGHAL